MGRVKLKIQRLESLSSRQVTFGKRRNGILKKAQEISVLCDIDILLLMFSPTGKPSVFRGQRSNIDEMIAKYAQLSPKERAKRRLESLETLKRNFKKVDQDVDIEEFLDASNPSIEELHNRVMVLQDQIAQVNKRQSWWTNPDKTDNMEHLNRMENSLTDTLNRVLLLKQEKFGQKTFDSTNQSQNGMQFPIPNTTNQECNTQSWLPGGENQQMILPNEPQFLATREMDCSRDISFPSCSGLFDVVKTEDIDKSRPEENERQDDGGISIDDYTNSAYLRLPLADQFPYHSYGTLSFPDMMEPPRELNFQHNPMDYQINSNFEIQRSVYNNLQHSLVPSAGSCAISIFNQNSYPQPPNQFNA